MSDDRKSRLSPEFLELLNSIDAKRAKTVIQHIIKHGYITTKELKDIYGYDHPPRAARDVREYGIPIVTFRMNDKDGKSMAAYKFGEFNGQSLTKALGRTAISKKIKNALIKKYGSYCMIYNEPFPSSQLQVDHRVPYEVGGEPVDKDNIDYYMLLSPSANRAKSWACEHCDNWKGDKNREICLQCFWAYPDEYLHIAMVDIRRLDLLWQGEEVKYYEAIKQYAAREGKTIQEVVKEIIVDFVKSKE